MRRNRPAFIEMLFFSEWLLIAIILLLASLSKQILLIFTLSERQNWINIFPQIGVDILIYPIIVGLVRIIFKVKKSEESISYSIRNRS